MGFVEFVAKTEAGKQLEVVFKENKGTKGGSTHKGCAIELIPHEFLTNSVTT